jgi:hypothetical protein
VVRERLQETRVQVSLAVMTLVLFVGIFVTVMLLNAPGPVERLASTVNSIEGCGGSVTSQPMSVQQAAFTPVPIGIAQSATVRDDIVCHAPPGSSLTLLGFHDSHTLRRALAADPALSKSPFCAYDQRYLIADGDSWSENERYYMVHICQELRGRRVGSNAAWRPVPY